jgi:Cu/Ag efflux pump CusA
MQTQRAARSLAVALTIAVLAVFLLLLYLALGSVLEVLGILVSPPVALVGAVVALGLSGETWNP